MKLHLWAIDMVVLSAQFQIWRDFLLTNLRRAMQNVIHICLESMCVYAHELYAVVEVCTEENSLSPPIKYRAADVFFSFFFLPLLATECVYVI